MAKQYVTLCRNYLYELFLCLYFTAKSCVINGKKHGVRIVMVCDGNVTDEVSVLSDCENEADLERVNNKNLLVRVFTVNIFLPKP